MRGMKKKIVKVNPIFLRDKKTISIFTMNENTIKRLYQIGKNIYSATKLQYLFCGSFILF